MWSYIQSIVPIQGLACGKRHRLHLSTRGRHEWMMKTETGSHLNLHKQEGHGGFSSLEDEIPLTLFLMTKFAHVSYKLTIFISSYRVHYTWLFYCRGELVRWSSPYPGNHSHALSCDHKFRKHQTFPSCCDYILYLLVIFLRLNHLNHFTNYFPETVSQGERVRNWSLPTSIWSCVRQQQNSLPHRSSS